LINTSSTLIPFTYRGPFIKKGSTLLWIWSLCCLSIFAEKIPSGEGTEAAGLPYKIPVWVKQGSQFVPGLGKDSFQLILGKKNLKNFQLQSPNSPTLLFIAFDTVGDVAPLMQVRDTLGRELAQLPSNFRIGLLSAHENFGVIQDPTVDRGLLRQKINEMALVGKAGLLNTIQPLMEFSSQLLRRTNVRVAILLITDSDIGNYRTNYLNPVVNYSDTRDLSRRFPGRALQEKIARITSSLSAYPVPCLIVHIDPGADPMNKIYQDGLRQLSETLGGQLFLSKTASDIPIMLRESLEWIKGFYILSFDGAGEKKGVVKIQIGSAEAANSAVTAERFYYPSYLTFR
jgi:hypothetical protein